MGPTYHREIKLSTVTASKTRRTKKTKKSNVSVLPPLNIDGGLTCTYCHTSNLHWGRIRDASRLVHNNGEMHSCQQYIDAHPHCCSIIPGTDETIAQKTVVSKKSSKTLFDKFVSEEDSKTVVEEKLGTQLDRAVTLLVQRREKRDYFDRLVGQSEQSCLNLFAALIDKAGICDLLSELVCE